MNTLISAPALVFASALLLAQPAHAQSDYSTDTAEVDIATIKSDKVNATSLKQDSNVRLRVQHSIYSIVPLKIEVLDDTNTTVANLSTRDRIIYMHLPEGRYTIRVNGIIQKKTIDVDANDSVLKSYEI